MIVSHKQFGIAAATLSTVAMVSWFLWPAGPVTVRGSGDLLTIAATGDSLILRPLPSSDEGVKGVAGLLRSASVAVTNLEENLLDTARIPRADNPEDVRWPFGTKRVSQDLRALGFTLISLANNHAIDYGADGLAQTEQTLDHAGLLHAGAGEDFAQAAAPVFVGDTHRRVALIAVTTSASAESRATPPQGEILGRQGVNALRYSPDVTADPATFATLKQSPAFTPGVTPGKNPAEDQLTVAGKTIKKGQRTAVEMIANTADADGILKQIRSARAGADIVIVSIHSHEPDNASPEPAEFLKSFARAAIDAGASVVMGHGPHRLRGIEVYKSGVIFYSLGNFAFDFSRVKSRSEDAFEAGIDLYRLALGAIPDSELPPQPADNRLWWESVIATAQFDRGVMQWVRLQPIDLGVDLPLAQRGTPRLADAARSTEVLRLLTDLSREFGTTIRIENGTGVISTPAQREP
jgi:poly-gamma-glutamate capsule biosynthesis protein CapA/YwtB (metallophosphatase superfamily)